VQIVTHIENRNRLLDLSIVVESTGRGGLFASVGIVALADTIVIVHLVQQTLSVEIFNEMMKFQENFKWKFDIIVLE
jgi:hypothetical protein